MQGNGGGAGFDGDAPRIKMRMVFIVNAYAHLYRYWDVGALSSFDGGGDNIAKEASLIWQSGTTAATGHLGNWAAKVHIDVVRQVLVHDHLCCLISIFRIHRINLQ